MQLSYTPGETVERSDGHRSELARSNNTIADLVAKNRSLEQSLARANEDKERYRGYTDETVRAYNGLVVDYNNLYIKHQRTVNYA